MGTLSISKTLATALISSHVDINVIASSFNLKMYDFHICFKKGQLLSRCQKVKMLLTSFK